MGLRRPGQWASRPLFAPELQRRCVRLGHDPIAPCVFSSTLTFTRLSNRPFLEHLVYNERASNPRYRAHVRRRDVDENFHPLRLSATKPYQSKPVGMYRERRTCC